MKVNLGRFPKNINGKRKISVKIEPFDTWSMDHSLAYIIHPMLLQLKKTKHSSPSVDDEDVPEELRSTSAPTKEYEYDIDAFHHGRWEWVLDEMIWAFEKIIDVDVDQPNELRQAHHERIKRGTTFFGKYYENLWD